MESVLSLKPNDKGFYYGHKFLDPCRIDVRLERTGILRRERWVYYVAGRRMGATHEIDDAERAAIAWLEQNPINPGDPDMPPANPIARFVEWFALLGGAACATGAAALLSMDRLHLIALDTVVSIQSELGVALLAMLVGWAARDAQHRLFGG